MEEENKPSTILEEVEKEQNAQDNTPHKKKQRRLLLVGVGILLAVFAFDVFRKKLRAVKQDVAVEAEKVVKVPENLIAGEGQWQKYLDERVSKTIEEQNQRNKGIEELSEKFQSLLEQQAQLINSLQERIEQQDQQFLAAQETNTNPSGQPNLSSFGAVDALPAANAEDSLPKDISIYIPASTYVRGWLLSGIAVPTGVSIQSNPMPVIIRLDDDANLPGGFKSNLKGCKIVGSCYGDLSSERALIRAETLVCVDPKSRQSITTKIAGFIVGPDGVTGLRGKVAEVNKKYIGSAIAGGILGGLGRAAKTSGETVISPLGMMSQAPQSFTDNFKNESLSSAGDVANKISDYYIKKAESIAPVLQVPAGVKLDVVFTEGVFFGQLNTKERVAEQRQESKNINN